ncbi:MAG: hypothetical protein U9R34_00785 [Nanoarchaeota archaeon]|nr:hypothetical protein [Nanoarchaeota archaeon]
MNIINERKRRIIIITLVIFCMILTYVLKVKFGVGRVYTHLFYIPIILACYWYEKKGLIVAFILALYLAFSTFIYKGHEMGETYLFDIMRSVMFLIIGMYTAFLSTQLNKGKKVIMQSHSELKQSYKKLKESDKKLKQQSDELRKSKKELQTRVNELERFHNIVVGRELKMVELKKEIKNLKKIK